MSTKLEVRCPLIHSLGDIPLHFRVPKLEQYQELPITESEIKTSFDKINEKLKELSKQFPNWMLYFPAPVILILTIIPLVIVTITLAVRYSSILQYYGPYIDKLGAIKSSTSFQTFGTLNDPSSDAYKIILNRWNSNHPNEPPPSPLTNQQISDYINGGIGVFERDSIFPSLINFPITAGVVGIFTFFYFLLCYTNFKKRQVQANLEFTYGINYLIQQKFLKKSETSGVYWSLKVIKPEEVKWYKRFWKVLPRTNYELVLSNYQVQSDISILKEDPKKMFKKVEKVKAIKATANVDDILENSSNF